MDRRLFFRTATVLASTAGATAFTSPTWAQSRQDEESTLRPLTAEEWRQIEKAALDAGDKESADAAAEAAARAESTITPYLVPTAIKQAAKAALRYGRGAIPKPIRPYTDKILEALDNANAWTEAALTASFMSAGIPPDVSQQAAWWLTNIVV